MPTIKKIRTRHKYQRLVDASIPNKKLRTKKLHGGLLFGLIVFQKEKVARYLTDKVLEKVSVTAYDKETQSLVKRGLIKIFEKLQRSYKYIHVTYKNSKGNIETKQLHNILNVKMVKTGTGSYKPDSKSTNNHLNILCDIVKEFAVLLQTSHSSSYGRTDPPTPNPSSYRQPTYWRKENEKYGTMYFFDKTTSVPVETVFQQLSSPDAGAFDSHRPAREKKERHNIARKFINLANEYARALSYFMLYKSEHSTSSSRHNLHHFGRLNMG